MHEALAPHSKRPIIERTVENERFELSAFTDGRDRVLFEPQRPSSGEGSSDVAFGEPVSRNTRHDDRKAVLFELTRIRELVELPERRVEREACFLTEEQEPVALVVALDRARRDTDDAMLGSGAGGPRRDRAERRYAE